MPTDTLLNLCALLILAGEHGFLKKAVFSKCADPNVLRAAGRLFAKDGRLFLQLEYQMRNGKAMHKNFPADAREKIAEAASAFSQINLIGEGAAAEYKRSKSGSETILGERKFLAAVSAYEAQAQPLAHNREKQYLLRGDEPFLRALGISDASGRIYDKKHAKFRQIHRFVEQIADIYKALPQTGELHVLDLCCGKSYLSFAAYHYLHTVMGRTVKMTGIDRKEDVIGFCSETAEKLGFDGLQFFAADIDRFHYETPVDLVLSLHACDIATDIVLTKAMELGASVILSTPCCQHELLANLTTDEFSFITRYPILKKKLCDALTDALRLLRLEAGGYTAEAIEFTDPDDTPKNILLRAVKKVGFDPNAPESASARTRFAALCSQLTGERNLYLSGRRDK